LVCWWKAVAFHSQFQLPDAVVTTFTVGDIGRFGTLLTATVYSEAEVEQGLTLLTWDTEKQLSSLVFFHLYGLLCEEEALPWKDV
jgi:hypothetical protein